MGMYTELYLRCGLKEATPKDVIDLLRTMVEGTAEEVPFGRSARCLHMLNMGSHYHHPYAKSSLDYADYIEQHFLFVRCDLKNYENEIEDFLAWIKPHLDASEGEYLGHTRYEEDPLPTFLIYGQGMLA